MKKEELHKMIFEAFAQTQSTYNVKPNEVDLSTVWCLDKFDTDYFISILEEKIPEDLDFLRTKRFDFVHDVCMEMEHYLPLEQEIKPRLIAQKQNNLTNDFDKQRN